MKDQVSNKKVEMNQTGDGSYAAVEGRLSLEGLKHMQGGVVSMRVADRRWLTIWHGDRPSDTLLDLVPEVAGQRLGCQDIQEG
jgi:hypothetical protein